MIVCYTVAETRRMTDVILIFHFGLFSALLPPYRIQNSPQQSANAEAFAEVYLSFIVSASAKKMPRQLNA